MAYDSRATKERILLAAGSEFAECGVSGARVDRIAAAAGANKRAIYDYFGDKDALFAAVLERQLTECAQDVPLDADDLVGYAEGLLAYHASHPQALRLLLWEALEWRGERVPAEPTRAAKYRSRVQAVAAAGSYQADPRLLVFLIMGVVNWVSVAPQIRRMIFGDDFPEERLRDGILSAVRALAEMPAEASLPAAQPPAVQPGGDAWPAPTGLRPTSPDAAATRSRRRAAKAVARARVARLAAESRATPDAEPGPPAGRSLQRVDHT